MPVIAKSFVGARVPATWRQQITAIATTSGRTEAEVVREALAAYLGEVAPDGVRGAIATLESRVSSLEGKLAGLGRLVG